jgi:hypothetical protein
VKEIENPRVGGSIPPLGTITLKPCNHMQGFFVCAMCQNCGIYCDLTLYMAQGICGNKLD